MRAEEFERIVGAFAATVSGEVLVSAPGSRGILSLAAPTDEERNADAVAIVWCRYLRDASGFYPNFVFSWRAARSPGRGKSAGPPEFEQITYRFDGSRSPSASIYGEHATILSVGESDGTFARVLGRVGRFLPRLVENRTLTFRGKGDRTLTFRGKGVDLATTDELLAEIGKNRIAPYARDRLRALRSLVQKVPRLAVALDAALEENPAWKRGLTASESAVVDLLVLAERRGTKRRAPAKISSR